LAAPADRPQIDWERAEHSPEFQELVTARRRFVIPATIFFLVWYTAFILLAGYAPDFMGETFLTDGLTVGYVLALTQFVMVFVLGLMYLRRAERVFDPLSDRAVERALETAPPHVRREAGLSDVSPTATAATTAEPGAVSATAPRPEAGR
jgi:uncharacterized membrane protein (DUF485 family)